jgi:hypothetical protein
VAVAILVGIINFSLDVSGSLYSDLTGWSTNFSATNHNVDDVDNDVPANAEEPSILFTARDYYPDHTKVPKWIESYIEFHNENVIFDENTNKASLKPGAK